MPYLQQTPFSETDIVLTFGSAPAFSLNENLVGQTSGAHGTLYGPLQGAGTDKYMVRDVQGAFTSGEVVKGDVSGATGTLSANGDSNGGYTLTSLAYGPVSVDGLSMAVASIGTAHQANAAGTMKVQVSDDVIPTTRAPFNPPTNWVDMPEYDSLAHVATMAAGAYATSAPSWPLLSWRWYRFVWTPSYTSNPTAIRGTVCFNTRTD